MDDPSFPDSDEQVPVDGESAQPTSSTEGWLGEVTPEDEERASRRLPDVYADSTRGKPQDPEREIIVHSRKTRISNKGIIIAGVVLLVVSCYLQVFRAISAQKDSSPSPNAVTTPAPEATQKAPDRPQQDVPAELPRVEALGAVSPGSAPINIRVVLANDSPAQSKEGKLLVTFDDPRRGKKTGEMPLPSINPRDTVTLNLRTPYISRTPLQEMGTSFIDEDGTSVSFNVEVVEK